MKEEKKDIIANQYEVIKRIGGGSFGEVFKVKNKKLGDRIEALKKIPLAHQDESKKRSFEKEIKSARLSINSIVQIFDVNFEQGFITTQFVDGLNLRELIKSGKPTYEEVCFIAKQVASALDKAHKQGVIHRDIKPSNIMISRDAEVYIIDFGIASLKSDKFDKEKSFAMTVGTIVYTAPERFWDPKAPPSNLLDIYSLGVTMYHCILSQLPFGQNADSSSAVFQVVEEIKGADPMKPSDVDPDIPEEVEAIIIKAMHKDTKQRYQTMRDLQEDLDKVLAGIETKIQGHLTETVKNALKNRQKCEDEKTGEIIDPSIDQGRTKTIYEPRPKKTSGQQKKVIGAVVVLLLIIILAAIGKSVIPVILPSNIPVEIAVEPSEVKDAAEITIDKFPYQKMKKVKPGKHELAVTVPNYVTFNSAIWLTVENNGIIPVTLVEEKPPVFSANADKLTNLDGYKVDLLSNIEKKEGQVPAWMYLDLGLIYELDHNPEKASQVYEKAKSLVQDQNELAVISQRLQRISSLTNPAK